MGWRIETNHVDEWKVISSIVDDVIAKFQTEEELKKWIAKEKLYEGKLKAIETLMSFPNQWIVNNERQRKKSGYYDWLSSIEETKTYDEYYEKIDKKLEKLLNEDKNDRLLTIEKNLKEVVSQVKNSDKIEDDFELNLKKIEKKIDLLRELVDFRRGEIG